MDTQPKLVAHADWSVAPAKRWLALAVLEANAYRAQPPQPVGDSQTLLSRLRNQAGANGAVLLGVDLPIGLPLAYARQVEVADFVALLPRLGQGIWRDFYRVAADRAEISLYRPFYPYRPGGTKQAHLLQSLNVATIDDLRRRCDKAQPGGRRAAAALFWTMGAQQVGKAAISGWRGLLAPGLDRGEIHVWPFQGALAELLQPGRIVVAETYPAECYRHLGVRFSSPQSGVPAGKRVQAARAAQAQPLLDRAGQAGVELDPGLRAAIVDGFGANSDGEDRFDAIVGLFGLLNVVLGRQPAGDPTDPAIRRVEGWIFGQLETREKDKQNEPE